jgi:hypothetical protein
MASPFKFLSMGEFEALDSKTKLAYISEAMEELKRANLPDHVRGWHSLFRQSQQQQQPQPKDGPDTPI